jgi:hypothetical protein
VTIGTSDVTLFYRFSRSLQGLQTHTRVSLIFFSYINLTPVRPHTGHLPRDRLPSFPLACLPLFSFAIYLILFVQAI